MKLLKKLSVFVLVFALLALTSCVPSADKAEEKMKEEGYYTIDLGKLGDKLLGGVETEGEDVETVMVFAKGENAINAAVNVLTGGDYVIAVYYKEAKAAKEAYNEMKSENEDTAAKRSGKCIYYGTEAGMKAFN